MCVFWEYEDPLNAWSSRGCHAIPEESTNEVTTCRCTHLTLFAVLLDPYNVEVNIFHYESHVTKKDFKEQKYVNLFQKWEFSD